MKCVIDKQPNMMMKSTVLFSILAVFCLLLSACGSKPHSPRVGEYGQELVINDVLSDKKIHELNTLVPKPISQSNNQSDININFQNEMGKNPYRFVVVVRGKAINRGKVNMGFTLSVASERKQKTVYMPLIEEDDNSYQTGEEVLLILASDPFSIDQNNGEIQYLINGWLQKRENIDIQHVELQVWQGKGSKYNSMSYIAFGLVLLVTLGLILRLMSLRSR